MNGSADEQQIRGILISSSEWCFALRPKPETQKVAACVRECVCFAAAVNNEMQFRFDVATARSARIVCRWRNAGMHLISSAAAAAFVPLLMRVN